MRPRDVERLLMALLPALSLATAGCDTSSKTDTSANSPVASNDVEAKPGEDAKPVADVKPTDDTKPTNDTKLDGGDIKLDGGDIKLDGGDIKLDGGDTAIAPDLKLPVARDVKLPTAPDARVPRERPRATCPTIRWCESKETAQKLSVDKKPVGSLGCPPSAPPEGVFDEVATKTKRAAGEADACCYSRTEQCPGGRPLLDETSTPVLAEFLPGDGWVQGKFTIDAPTGVLQHAAKHWLLDAAMEHASVASFGRVALELMSLGAPPDLIEHTHKAALDEIRHARTCLAIAVACGAAASQPGPLPICAPREPDFARFAADTFIEGCVGETTAALVIERAAVGVSDPALRRALDGIAEDEAAHAALAWRTVAWAIERGGPSVWQRVQLRAEAFRKTLGKPAVASDGDSALAQTGRLGQAGLDAARHDAWFGIIEPMLARMRPDGSEQARTESRA
ncbi:MAG: ferritin-like domain-containing protein [Nannocystaceae bacterium]|nr:ferritin-like domain-containing protein [Nannocystaceae bacterium]